MKLISLLFVISVVQAIVIDSVSETFQARTLWKFGNNRTIETLINQLIRKLEHTQSKRSTEYEPKFMYPPVTWKMKQGLFVSYIHLNFHGGPLQSKIRNVLSFPDDNGFVTMNILEVLLDLWDFDVKYPTKGLINAVRAILDHQDKNSRSNTPVFSFWSQKEQNTSFGTVGFQAHPTNIAVPIKIYKTFNGLINFSVKMLHLPENIQDIVSIVNDFSTMGGSIFSIPPDADDTGCALGVSAKLLQMSQSNSTLQLPSNVYSNDISDPKAEALDPYLKYAYRPYSENVDESVIDPRTYHWIRHFLNQKDGNVDLITTWFQHISEIHAQQEYQKMPFSVNNVDGSVVVNGLYGILSTIFAQPLKYASKITPSLLKLIVDSLDLVHHILENDLIAEHSASMLLYYPSKYAFYYFVSRLCNLMESEINTSEELPSEFLEIVVRYKYSLRIVMRKFGTQQLLSMKKDDPSGVIYWDDFLGNGDDHPTFEDRVFSSSMAFNALINTWTYSYTREDGSKNLRYNSDVPWEVTDVIEKAARFLTSKEADCG